MSETLNYYNVLKYYSQSGKITCLDHYREFTDWMAGDPEAIYQIVQGLIVHDMWVGQYGEEYIKNHEYPQNTAYMEDLLEKALELNKSSLSIPRHPRDRVIACCREFATLMCALLRAKGIPARSRCGFAVYFGWNGEYEDHWICEYWNGERWVMADPQLDPFQQSSVLSWGLKSAVGRSNLEEKIASFNPRDLKKDEFITAGQAWKLCREGAADPGKFGISCPIRPEWGITSLYGLWFVRGQLLRDFASLNKVETVPYLVRIGKGLSWKPWRLVAAKDEELTESDLLILDRIAELTLNPDENFDEICKIYENNNDITVPEEIVSR
jgi:Transglutaminase-like enzymes, putative cysteine proteases